MSEIREGLTPFYSSLNWAARLGVAKLFVKDESVHSLLSSFKALGAPIVMVRKNSAAASAI